MELGDLNGKRSITVMGSEVEVHKSDVIKDTVKKLLREKGVDSFVLVVDGNEVDNSADIPATFDDHEVEVKRYVKAG